MKEDLLMRIGVTIAGALIGTLLVSGCILLLMNPIGEGIAARIFSGSFALLIGLAGLTLGTILIHASWSD